MKKKQPQQNSNNKTATTKQKHQNCVKEIGVWAIQAQ